MKSNVRLRVIVTACLLFLLPICSNAQTVWYVNDVSTANDVFTAAIGNDANPGSAAAPFRTITQAISSAAAGDSIYVDAGDYNETIIDITKSLTIRGAKFGVPAGPAAVPVNRGTGESFLTGAFYFGPSTDNICVDGFHINMGSANRGIEARGFNSKILNNIVVATLNIFVQQCGISTRANGPLRLHSYEILNNHISNSRFGILFDGNLENPSDIFFNYVTGAFSTAYVLTGSGGHHYKGNVAENNVQGMLISLENNLIEQNTIQNNVGNGIRMTATARLQNNQIIHNFIQGNAIGIHLTEDNAGASNNRANYNSINGNGTNILSTHSNQFDAACNWHGTTDPLAIDALVNGNVRYAPFLLNGTDLDAAEPGFQTDMSCVVVPVKITSFTAEASADDAVLEWITEREINNNRFEIMRSANGTDYTQVGTVNGNGTSNMINRYRFIDPQVLANAPVWFYRLKQIDDDGRYEYSNVVVVKSRSTAALNVFPNPATDYLHIRINEVVTEGITYRLFNANGKMLKQGTVQQTLQRVELNRLPSGIYILSIRFPNGKHIQQRITVMR
ncbi:MAG TPA: T9SS type A sorting domain-containing protein [Ferruginibacter sp.]|nr:T9SS type A sorting domain-containing protein [Ferruginibacter sp.]HRO18121.1 T9SS type A sorting domain-containing protein [Ferruginibacter sp.]HRQ21528.1 T9SS type A sorting domain-containing protein [Ferruginibacter sp.]